MGELGQLIEQCTAEERGQILLVAYYVAFADGRFWREKPFLDRICRELDVPEKTAGKLKNEAARRLPNLTVPTSQAGRQLAYHYAVAVAASDGKLTGRERRIAELLGDHLALPKEEVAAQLAVSDPREEPTPGPRRPSRPEKPEIAEPDNYPVMLAGLVGKDSEAAAPGLAYLKSPTAIATVLGNLVPVLGVWLFDWQVFNVVFLYWLETVVMVVFMVLKTALFVFLYSEGPGGLPKKPLHTRVAACLIIVPIFGVSYGMAVFVYGRCLFDLFDVFRRDDSVWSPVMVVALVALFAQYGFLFLFEYVGKRKYLTIDPRSLTVQITGRMTVMQSAIMLGMVPLLVFSLPAAFLIVLICLKTGLDLRLIYRYPMLFSP